MTKVTILGKDTKKKNIRNINKNLYAYIQYISIKKRYNLNKKNQQWCNNHNLTPLHVMWLSLVK